MITVCYEMTSIDKYWRTLSTVSKRNDSSNVKDDSDCCKLFLKLSSTSSSIVLNPPTCVYAYIAHLFGYKSPVPLEVKILSLLNAEKPQFHGLLLPGTILLTAPLGFLRCWCYVIRRVVNGNLSANPRIPPWLPLAIDFLEATAAPPIQWR